MIKRIISAVLAFTLLMSVMFMFGGCGGSLEKAEIEKIYNEAVKATMEQDVYFLKETVNSKDEVRYTQVNVRASIDDKYEIERNEDGSYKELKIEAFEQLDGKEVVKNSCGASGDDGKSFLFTTTHKENGDPIRSKKQMSAKDYYGSEDFKKYRVETFFDELNYLKVSDMDFSVEKAEAAASGKVTSLIFAPTAEYLERYEKETGEKSLFDGCLRVSVEISHGKIAHIIVYKEDAIAGSNLSVEVESYKLLIVYYGPIVNIPDYKSEDWAKA